MSETYYGIVDGEWHAIRHTVAKKEEGDVLEVRSLCPRRLIPTSVFTYLGGDLCVECREVVTREIVEAEE